MKTTDVVLIHPWYPMGAELRRIPLGLAQLSAVLKSRGFNVKCQDLNFAELDLSGNVNFVCVSVWTGAFDYAIHILKEAKKRGIYCLAGGPHATADPHSLLYAGFDTVVRGEADYLLPTLLSDIESGADRRGIVNAGHPEDLNSIPYPDFSWVHKYPYIEKVRPIMTSRGCPFGCIFCGHCMGRKFRKKSPEVVVDELSRYEGYVIEYQDDVMTIDKHRIQEISRGVNKEGLYFEGAALSNGTRVDCIDRETLKALIDMGLTNIMYGLESADPLVLKESGKGITSQMVDDAIKVTKNLGIKPGIFMMIGLPYSTFEKDLYSIDWIEKREVFSNWGLTFPIPDTPLWKWVDENGIWLVDKNNYSAWTSSQAFHTADYTISERLRILQIAMERVQDRGEKLPLNHRLTRKVRNLMRLIHTQIGHPPDRFQQSIPKTKV